jgi:hypothetical protein
MAKEMFINTKGNCIFSLRKRKSKGQGDIYYHRGKLYFLFENVKVKTMKMSIRKLYFQFENVKVKGQFYILVYLKV